MSRRVTRALAKQVQEDPTLAMRLAQEEASVTAANRSLSDNELKRIKTFIVAHHIHRKKANSPTDYDNWEVLRPHLKRGFDAVLAAYTQARNQGKTDEEIHVIVEGLNSQNKAEKKWHELCLFLIASGVTTWRTVMNGVKTSFNRIGYTYTNHVEDLLSEGNVRHNVLKNLNLNDYDSFVGRRSHKWTNEEKAHFIMQLNDPKSKMFDQWITLFQRDLHENIPYAKYVLKNIRANIVDKSGQVTGVMEIDLNTHNPSSGSLLIKSLMGLKQGYNQVTTADFQFIRDLIQDTKIDVSIEWIVDAGENVGSVQTALSYALWFARPSMNMPLMWEVVKLIAGKRPLKELYMTSDNTYKNTYGVWKYKEREPSVIDNVWIARNLPVDKVEWLIENGGLDTSATADGWANIRHSLESQSSDAKDQLQTYQQELATTQSSIQTLEEQLETLIIAEKQQLKLATSIQEEYEDLMQARQRLDDTFYKYRIFGGGKKTKKKLKK